MATYRQILDEVTRKPGDTWQTAAGNWKGMKQGEKGEKNPTQSYGPEGKKKAKVYAIGGDPDKVDDGDETEKEPEKEKDETEPEKEQDKEVNAKLEKGTDGAREKIAKDVKSGKLSKEN